ncbi:MAG: CBS domain-containing protein [Deltaproteobacteria bacterium]|nr:CBS domain-containing protein [Deltaproteobacteria bacterium]
MEVITSHTNADFDTLASMLAAKKLYPEARLVLPGAFEKNLRDIFSSLSFPFKIDKLRAIDLAKVKRLILVDVSSIGRIGKFSELVGKKAVDVHIFDHHPRSCSDIKGSLVITEPVGSTTTILTSIIRKKKIRLTVHEATILMAGIYEDTGSLGFPSTTVKDFEAAAFLLKSGADLKGVSNFLKKELTAEDVLVLNEFIESAATYTIGGIDIIVAANSVEGYKGDIAFIAHRLMDMEKDGALFVLAHSGDRTHLVIRSSRHEIDAGSIARALGGGGHRSAASATIKGLTLVQTKEKLLSVIKEDILPQSTAEDIMSAPVIVVDANDTIAHAERTMLRSNVNAVLVARAKKLVGIITRQVAIKAIYHNLGGSRVMDYMTSDFETVSPKTPLFEIREKVIAHGQRLLPVVEGKKIIGVITRTDLIKLLQEELIEREGGQKKIRVVTGLMEERLPKRVVEMLRDAGRAADDMGFKAYIVGGFVRDLILKRENLDIDLVIEGDGVMFAREFAKRRGLRVHSHERFKTAVITFPDGFELDVATTRLEYYERPGALPTVELSSLKLDLYRRDFTINTLALALNPECFGSLIDFFDARHDIKEKTIRVIHNLSFVEDPTRVLRAVRFAERFGFNISPQTLGLIKNTVKQDFFKHLSGARICEELKSIIEEDTAVHAVKRLHGLGVLALIDKGLLWNKNMEQIFERTGDVLAWHRLLYTKNDVRRWIVFFFALTDALSETSLKGLAKRLSIVNRKEASIIASRERCLCALKRIKANPRLRNSELFSLLNPLPIEVVLYLMAKTTDEQTRKSISLYITRLKGTETYLDGDDLKRMGVLEGPSMGKMLKTLLEKRLDGELETKEDEETFVAGKTRK